MENKSSIEESVRDLNQIREKIRGLFGTSLFKESYTIKTFIREKPEETKVLTDYFKENTGIVERTTTWSKEAKVKTALKEYHVSKEPNAFKRFMKRHPAVWKTVVGGLIAGQGYFSARAPNHPLSVDTYLVKEQIKRVLNHSEQYSREKLEDFLIIKEQIERYPVDCLEDAKDPFSEKAFVIIEKDGKLEQKEIRTINKNIPFIPASFLDRKHITRIDDEMDLVAQGYKIVANGHYHVWGEPPSEGDRIAGMISGKNEIVVANGFVPLIYFNSNLVSFGKDMVIDHKLSSFLSNLYGVCPYPKSPKYSSNRNRHAQSFLNYLSNSGVDVADVSQVVDFLRRNYSDSFQTLYLPLNNLYLNNPNYNKFSDSFDAIKRFPNEIVSLIKGEVHFPTRNLSKEDFMELVRKKRK